MEIARKLNLHRPAHLLCTKFLCQLQDFGQREHVVLQDARKRDDLAATFVDAIAYDLVNGVVGRGNALQ